jgi:hypothetical protein
MKRQIPLLLPFLLICSFVQAQDSTFRSKHYKELSLTLVYNYHRNFQSEEGKANPLHFLEVGLWRSNIFSGRHPFSATYYVANDFGLNTQNFAIGPKIGAFASILVLGLGAELCYYTDFKSGAAWRFIPSFGLFTPYFKASVNLTLILNNSDNSAITNFSVAMRVFRLKRKLMTDSK